MKNSSSEKKPTRGQLTDQYSSSCNNHDVKYYDISAIRLQPLLSKYLKIS